MPLRDVVAKRLRQHVLLDNDANVGALAEHRYGAGRGSRNMVYVTFSTGVGMGARIGGSSCALERAGLAEGAGGRSGVGRACESSPAKPGPCAIAARRALRIRYFTATRGEESERVVHPYTLEQRLGH